MSYKNSVYIVLLLLNPLCISAQDGFIHFQNIKQTRLSEKKTPFTIKAKSYKIDPQQIAKEYKFFNRKKIAQKYQYYENGTIASHKYTILFTKAYISDNNIHLQTVTIQEAAKKHDAKECISKIHSSLLKCEKVRIYKKKQLYGVKRLMVFNY